MSEVRRVLDQGNGLKIRNKDMGFKARIRSLDTGSGTRD